MITERLYFADPYLTHFSARVVARDQRDQHPAVALDQSAFYPQGGGQPADTGTLNGAAVLDVQVEDGVVWHMLDQTLEADTVQGAINWERRFDHMQQHHGQHLLSASFERLYGLRTVSFHLGTGASTIDLAATDLASAQAAAAEDLTNQVIWEDRPILARFVTAEELARLPLRSYRAWLGRCESSRCRISIIRHVAERTRVRPAGWDCCTCGAGSGVAM